MNWRNDESDAKHSSFSEKTIDLFYGSGQIETSNYEARTSLLKKILADNIIYFYRVQHDVVKYIYIVKWF